MEIIHYTVDDKRQEASEHNLTSRQILKNAGINPDNHYLDQIDGDHVISYKDKPDELIHMRQHMKFLSVFMDIIHYKVDEKKQETTEHKLTPRQILKNAGINPDNHYLDQIDGDHVISYKDKPDELIHMRQHMRFISIFNGPTTVS